MEQMPSRRGKAGACVGVFDHWGWAVLVTVAADGKLLDRRRVELVDATLPKFPHHHEALRLPVAEGVALVERVARSAQREAQSALEALASSLRPPIAGIALRVCPPLPATIAERLADYRAQNVADSVLYREALAWAARARGWSVHWYEAKTISSQAARALGRSKIDDLLQKAGATLGPPWQKDHMVAMAAAIASNAREPAG
jgi:hypothetical protein